ncbi:MAG: hypothetical protein QW478_05370 [Candidatus Micrarchaeaceae archaeon]
MPKEKGMHPSRSRQVYKNDRYIHELQYSAATKHIRGAPKLLGTVRVHS